MKVDVRNVQIVGGLDANNLIYSTISCIPDEITLVINLNNDIGNKLDNDLLDELIMHNNNLTCIAFSGDIDFDEINKLAKYIRLKYKLLIALKLDDNELPTESKLINFDYIKLSNQLYRVAYGNLINLTYKYNLHE